MEREDPSLIKYCPKVNSYVPKNRLRGEECVRESARGGADRFSPDSPNVAAVTEDAPEEPKNVKKMKVVELKEELKKRNQPIRGNKAELQERLLDAMQNNAPLVADQDATRVDNMAGPSYNHHAYWKLVSNENGDELLDEREQMQIDGLQFRAPGVPEAELDNTLGPKKRNYTMAFDRPPFVQNVLLPKKDKSGRVMKKRGEDGYLYERESTEDSVPNLDFLFKNGINVDSQPCEWFDLFMPMRRKRHNSTNKLSVEDLTTWTNLKALLDNAGEGGGVYPKFIPFTIPEIAKHLGLYMLNGISPSPQVELKFFSQFEMLLTNAYVVYLKFQTLHRHQPISHYEFHRQVALAWLKPDEYWGKKSEKKQRRSPRSHSGSSTESIVSTSIGARRSLYIQSEDKKETRCHRVTDMSLHPFTGKLKDRLNISKMHLPIEATKSDSRCQLHMWAANMRFRTNIVCTTCNVTLCIRCFAHFHLVHDLVKSKAMIKKEIVPKLKI